METDIQNNGETLGIETINKTTMPPKKKASRGVHVFSVVMHMLRRRRRRKPFNTGFWRRVVDSVRKARSEITIMPPSPNFINTIYLPPPPTHDDVAIDQTVQEEDGVGKDDHDDSGEVGRPEVFTAATSSSSSGISGYGSAMSLRDLGYHDGDDEDDDDDDVDCFSDIEEGDDMIDEKAEEFIMRFYEQMKMQNQVYTQRSNKAKGINNDLI